MFNCNVNYSGLVHAVTAEGWFKENKVCVLGSNAELVQHFTNSGTTHCLRIGGSA